MCIAIFSTFEKVGVFFLVGGGHYFVAVVISFVYLCLSLDNPWMVKSLM